MAYTKGIAEIIDEVRETKSNSKKVAKLKEYNVQWMHQLLFMTYSTKWQWLLPDTEPPYKPNDPSTDLEGQFYGDIERFYLFRLPGPDGSNIGHPTLTQARRETLYVQVLESVAPKDAKLILEITKNKIKGVPISVVSEAFPDLLNANL
jgi:hypothetical protein